MSAEQAYRGGSSLLLLYSSESILGIERPILRNRRFRMEMNIPAVIHFESSSNYLGMAFLRRGPRKKVIVPSRVSKFQKSARATFQSAFVQQPFTSTERTRQGL